MADREELERAMKSGRPVRVYRSGLEDGWLEGYVIGCGPVFFVMAMIDKAVHLDGYSCLRYADIDRCEIPAPFAGVIEKALQLHGETPERPKELAAPDLRQILKFASRQFGLITVEDEDPEAAMVGRVRFVSDSFFQMSLIGPDAEWEPETAEFDFNEIHRVDFGGAYEQTLLRVAQSGGQSAAKRADRPD